MIVASRRVSPDSNAFHRERVGWKCKEVNSNGDNASNTLGTCLIRFADVLLMKAEALIWKTG